MGESKSYVRHTQIQIRRLSNSGGTTASVFSATTIRAGSETDNITGCGAQDPEPASSITRTSKLRPNNEGQQMEEMRWNNERFSEATLNIDEQTRKLEPG